VINLLVQKMNKFQVFKKNRRDLRTLVIVNEHTHTRRDVGIYDTSYCVPTGLQYLTVLTTLPIYIIRYTFNVQNRGSVVVQNIPRK